MGNIADSSWFEEQLENMEEDFAFLSTNTDEPYDHSIDVVDPDEEDLPGPDYDSYGYNDPVEVEEDMSYVDSLLTTGFDNIDEVEDWIDSHIGEPEYLGDR